MSKLNKKRDDQLGMDFGTANSKLRKNLLFELSKQLQLDICFRCGKKIEKENEFSIDHKVPWLDSTRPLELFFDFNNIAFSHLHCNTSHGRTLKQLVPCPSLASYKRGCRCEGCRKANYEYHKQYKRQYKQKNNRSVV